MGSQCQSNLYNNNNNNNMIALLFCSLIVAAAASSSCQNPGNAICHSSDPNLPRYVQDSFAPCCDGSECLPVDDHDDARFCQFVQDIPAGGDCSERKGSCVASSSCVDGVCV